MENSAMFRAFRMLRNKPVLLLLLLPINIISVLSVAFMPDMSRFLDFNAMMSNPEAMMSSMQLSNIVTSLVSSAVGLVCLAGIFLLLPPAMELMRNEAAKRETPSGWYTRGLRAHWWKPVVNGLVAQGIVGILIFGLYIVLAIVLMAVILPLMGANLSGLESSTSPDELLNGMMSGAMPAIIAIGAAFGVIIFVLTVIIRSLLGLLLPALADRSFGEAFKLMFSRRGFRKFPKLLGGLFLIELIPGVFYVALFAAYFLMAGMPSGPMGFVTLLLNFMRSWAGILGLLLTYVIKSLTYPFEFSVYQQVLEEEGAAQEKLLIQQEPNPV